MSNAYRSTLAGGGAAVGDATAADVLTGKTFSGAVGSGVAGTMPNQGAVSGTATPSQPYTIPAGYHNGSGVVTAGGVTLNHVRLTSGSAVNFSATDSYAVVGRDSSGNLNLTHNGEAVSDSTTFITNAVIRHVGAVNVGDTFTFDQTVELFYI